MKILFANDGSKYALEAAHFLSSAIRHESGVEIVSMNVASPLLGGSARPPIPSLEEATRRRREARARLAAPEAVLEAGGFRVERQILRGDPQRVLLEACKGFGMVVVGIKGEGASPFFEVGRVALALLRHSPVSVLLVRRRRDLPEGAGVVTPTGCRFLMAVGEDREGVEHTWDTLDALSPPAAEVEVVTVKDPEKPVRAKGAKRDRGEHAHHFAPRVLKGRPAAELERRAVDTSADLIILGPRSDAPLGSEHMGTTARELIWCAPCSVLLVRAPQPAVLHSTEGRSRSRLPAPARAASTAL